MSLPRQSQEQPQQQISNNVDPRTSNNFLNIEDMLDVRMDVEMDDKFPKPDQEQLDGEYVAPLKTQKDLALFKERFAYNMRVGSMNILGETKNYAPKPTRSIVETVSSITSCWKGQAEALSLSPADTLDFYRRQYDQLCDVLSISLFSRRPDSQIVSAACSTDSGGKSERESGIVQTDDTKNVGEKKRKRNAAPNNDCEYIFFEKDGRFVYRRVESAAKYAKRIKPAVERYVCIVPKKEEFRENTRNCMTKLRAFDSKFTSGSEVNFAGSFSELYNDIVARINRVSMDRFSTVKYVDGNSTENEDNDEKDTTENDRKNSNVTGQKDSDSRQVKRLKTERSEPKTVLPVPVKRIVKKTIPPVNAEGGETTYRSGVEEYTDESEESSEDESGEGDAKDPLNTLNESSCKVMYGSNGKESGSGEIATDGHLRGKREPDFVKEQESERPPSPFLQKIFGRSTSKESKKKH